MGKDGRLVVIFLYLLCLTRAQISFDVQEEKPAPLLLGNIASKANITKTAGMEFHLMTKNDLFAVDASTGDFSAIVVLDRESQCGSSPSCIITTLVAVSRSPDSLLRYTVNVTIHDANDQKPYFKFTSFPKSLSEFVPLHTTIKLPTAEDNDMEPSFKVQKYYLLPESQTVFDLVVQRVNQSDGSVDFDVQLRLKQKLDREKADSYTLTLVASDLGSPSNEGRLQVVITVTDENDNSPVFQKPEYNITINESTPIDTSVLNVLATDADIGENGRVGYEISNNIDRRVTKYFVADRASGAVKVASSLKKEGETVFIFKVKAFDHGTPMMFSEVNVRISVEDTVNDPPGISVSLLRPKNNSAVVSEDAVVGTTVAIVDVTDTDVGLNGQTNCTCISESFSMKEYNSPGAYTISVAAGLDREKISTHVITIQCMDKGTPPLSSMAKLSVIVEDVNDHPPQFTRRSYEMRVRENQESGVLVGNVFATDADDGVNAQLRYSLDPSVVEFEINESNGFVYTAVKNLDREMKDRYSFSVYAFDTSFSPHTATATVIVNIEDVNDEWPRFDNSSYRFLVSESTITSTVIGKVHATDPDLGLGGRVEYLFVHSPLYMDPPFILSKDNGAITLTQALDYETTRQYSFVVTAVDLGNPPRNSSVEVHIEVTDVNDNDPVIAFPNPDNLSVTLNLDVTPGQEIIRVIAHDSDHGDSGRLTYSLGAMNTSVAKLFWINEDTGLLTLVAPLTQADVRSYNIVISVNDNGVPQRATQALLHIEIVHDAKESRSRESYTTIVIIMVCVTLLVAVVVLVTLCFIKYIDKRKFDSERSIHKSTFEPMNKLTDDYLHTGGGDDEMEHGMIISPVHQKQIPSFQNQRLGSNSRNGKKCVTFDSAIRSSDTSTVSGSVSTQPDSGFSSIGSGFHSAPNSVAQVPYVSTLASTFNPGSLDLYKTNCIARSAPSPTMSSSATNGPPVPLFFKTTRTNSGTSLMECGTGVHSSSPEFQQIGADEVVGTALQNHNALVRSVRSKDRRPPYASRQVSLLVSLIVDTLV
ncbi:unnamed protein product [Candidula unifasciata]|uniref:Cadherin domain-containing protein n=1 Tax=Candidula unifasciata TaxID=100452 RepID=A0A8S3YXE1_9EUPU|nr:unnamed protein product [Candidula unifasciata]